jgi:hypothetical protein
MALALIATLQVERKLYPFYSMEGLYKKISRKRIKKVELEFDENSRRKFISAFNTGGMSKKAKAKSIRLENASKKKVEKRRRYKEKRDVLLKALDTINPEK